MHKKAGQKSLQFLQIAGVFQKFTDFPSMTRAVEQDSQITRPLLQRLSPALESVIMEK